MKKKVLVVLVVLAMLVPIIVVSASTIFQYTKKSEPEIILRVPDSWGPAVSIARRPMSINILFSDGHIVIVRIPLSYRTTYMIKIERTVFGW